MNLRAVIGIADRSQVNPTVIVVIECGETPGVFPVHFWELHLLKLLAIDIAPERHARLFVVRKGHVHPTVLVEVERHYAVRVLRHLILPRLESGKGALARVRKNRRRRKRSYNKINGPIVVDIGGNHTAGKKSSGQSGLLTYILEGAIAVVAQQQIRFGISSMPDFDAID